MARGWESKSVEQQQAETLEVKPEHKRPLSAQELAKARQREGLLLSRKHILDEMQTSQNPRRRQMLESALADLDSRLAALG